MSGKSITVKTSQGDQFQAYMATPPSGKGPGLVLLQEIFGVNQHIRDVADLYAEEGYVVLAPDLFWRFEPGIELDYTEEDFAKAFGYYQKFNLDTAVDDVKATMDAMKGLPELNGKIGVLGFCAGGTVAFLSAARLGDVACAVSYYGADLPKHFSETANAKCPMVFHCAGKDKYFPTEQVDKLRDIYADREDVSVFLYDEVDHAFNRPGGQAYDKLASQIAHTRTIALLRECLGPKYDLSAIWENHLKYEFEEPVVEKLMPTMVDEPYVNHIPVITGGYGYKELRRFYKYHFLNTTPPDTKLKLISRTVGADRIVDEFIFCFTHDREIDWMLPGIAPTHKYVEVPFVGIICIRGTKLYHEHIYWDQASVLVQLGLLDPTGLPVTGAEQAAKLLDESIRSNDLMARWKESEGKPL